MEHCNSPVIERPGASVPRTLPGQYGIELMFELARCTWSMQTTLWQLNTQFLCWPMMIGRGRDEGAFHPFSGSEGVAWWQQRCADATGTTSNRSS